MKQTDIIREHHPRLLLFFAGWGADETPFKEYRPLGSDYILCYDYRTLEFDASHLQEYQEIHVIGWSMGVWAASQTMAGLIKQGLLHEEQLHRRIAINGTTFPIDETRGIPPAIFQGTLTGLTDASLHKFLRRMCADSRAFREFLEVTPRRPLEELREELAAIARQYAALPTLPFRWSQAFVGLDDRIIPPDNQLHAWQEENRNRPETVRCEVIAKPVAHYEREVFRHYLQELWTND